MLHHAVPSSGRPSMETHNISTSAVDRGSMLPSANLNFSTILNESSCGPPQAISQSMNAGVRVKQSSSSICRNVFLQPDIVVKKQIKQGAANTGKKSSAVMLPKRTPTVKTASKKSLKVIFEQENNHPNHSRQRSLVPVSIIPGLPTSHRRLKIKSGASSNN